MSTQTPTITAFLAWLYGEKSLLTSPYGTVYPLTAKFCTVANPEDVLLELTDDKRQFPSSSWLLEEMKHKHQHLWNGDTYVLLNLEESSSYPQLRCAKGHYFDTVNTCMVLEEELKQSLAAATPELDWASLYASMPLRRAIHQERTGDAALADAWTGDRRSAAISISCLFAANDGVNYRYYVRRRAANLADGAGLYHVIPSMVFQPMGKGQDGFSITNTILREVAEELFDREEADSLTLYPEIAALRELLQTGWAELVVTGVIVDLPSLRPEIMTVLVVHDPQWLQQYEGEIRFSGSEYVTDTDKLTSYRDLDDDSVLQLGGEFAPENCVVSGAACLILGLPVARQLRDKYSNAVTKV